MSECNFSHWQKQLKKKRNKTNQNICNFRSTSLSSHGDKAAQCAIHRSVFQRCVRAELSSIVRLCSWYLSQSERAAQRTATKWGVFKWLAQSRENRPIAARGRVPLGMVLTNRRGGVKKSKFLEILIGWVAARRALSKRPPPEEVNVFVGEQKCGRCMVSSRNVAASSSQWLKNQECGRVWRIVF